MPEPLVVKDRKTAAAFGETRRRRLIVQLARRELSLVELAQATGLSLSLLSYHLKHLCGLGLVEITRQTPRAGRPIKYYRAVSTSFFVPSHLEKSSPRRELQLQLDRAVEHARLASADEGTLYSIDDNGSVRAKRVTQGGRSVAMDHWRILRLTDTDAERLAEELKDTLHRYSARPEDPRARPYLARAVLAPQL